jgi:UDPglucose 6-dehydrogenase
MRPDRVVVGGDDERALLLMRALYAPFVRNRDRMLMMGRRCSNRWCSTAATSTNRS